MAVDMHAASSIKLRSSTHGSGDIRGRERTAFYTPVRAEPRETYRQAMVLTLVFFRRNGAVSSHRAGAVANVLLLFFFVVVFVFIVFFF